MTRANLLRTCLLGLMLVFGCKDDVVGLTWNYDASAIAGGTAFEARILAERCGGDVLWFDRFGASGGGMQPPDLEEGTFAFEIIVRDEQCNIIGLVCDELSLPLASNAHTSVIAPATGAPCPMCNAGVCGTLEDAGMDAPQDAVMDVEVDAPEDAGMDAPQDAPIDGSTECDCCAGERCTPTGCEVATPISEVTLGSRHGCAITEGGRVFCWGFAGAGATGQGLGSTPHAPRYVDGGGWHSIAAGNLHSCGIRGTERGVFCFGSNDLGECGIEIAGGDSPNIGSPMRTDVDYENVSSITAGFSSTCILAEGVVRCFGWNRHFAIAAEDERVEEGYPSGVEVRPLPPIRQIVGHELGYAALDEDSLAWGWGLNDSERLTSDLPMVVEDATAFAMSSAFDYIALGRSHTCGSIGGVLHCWGNPSSNPGAHGHGTRSVGAPLEVIGAEVCSPMTCPQPISASTHTCFIDNEQTLKCMGTNASGELGSGDRENHLTPNAVDSALRFRYVDVGDQISCAIDENGGLYCFGESTEFRVGIDGDDVLRPTRLCPPAE